MTRMISIARDFSRNPAGRFKSDGPFSGERFREDFLIPALRSADAVEVDLNGALGFGSSFLEEAFGGLVRNAGFNYADLRGRLTIRSELRTYADRIWRYVEEARPA